MPIPGSRDNARHQAAKEQGWRYPNDAPVPVWDFVIVRSDGSEKALHPQQTTRKIMVRDSVAMTQTSGKFQQRIASSYPSRVLSQRMDAAERTEFLARRAAGFPRKTEASAENAAEDIAATAAVAAASSGDKHGSAEAMGAAAVAAMEEQESW